MSVFEDGNNSCGKDRTSGMSVYVVMVAVCKLAWLSILCCGSTPVPNSNVTRANSTPKSGVDRLIVKTDNAFHLLCCLGSTCDLAWWATCNVL